MEKNKVLSTFENKFYQQAAPIVKECGFDIYDVEYHQGGKLLRLFIMNPQTQSAVIDDCVKVDNALTALFESADWIPEEVTLEVSSPGVYRHLADLKHFEMSIDQIVSVTITGELPAEKKKTLPVSLAGQKKFRGPLKKISEEAIGLQVDEYLVEIAWPQIKKAIIDPDFQTLINQNKEIR